MSRVRSLRADTARTRGCAVAALVLVATALLPLPASALAGLAEHQRTYEYTRFANLVAVSPGDVCEGADKYCLLVLRPDGRALRSADGSLEAVSRPSDAQSPYVLARRSRDDAWLVLDLRTDTVLAESPDIEGALAVWEELGLADPELVGARDAHLHLEETRDSVMFRWGIQIVLLALGALIPSLLLLLVFGGLARALKRAHHDTGSPIRLLLARLLMVPATLAGIVLALCIAVLLAVWVINLM